jgi:hypothetical protein
MLNPEDEGNRSLRKLGNTLPNDTAYLSLNSILVQSKNCPFGANTMYEWTEKHSNYIPQYRHTSQSKHTPPIWAAFLCGYPLLHPYFLPTKNAQRHAVLSWYMYSGAPPSCNSYYVCTAMRIPIVVCHNKTR